MDRDQQELPNPESVEGGEEDLATPKQKQYMTSLGIRWDENTTKTEASDLIDKKLEENKKTEEG